MGLSCVQHRSLLTTGKTRWRVQLRLCFVICLPPPPPQLHFSLSVSIGACCDFELRSRGEPNRTEEDLLKNFEERQKQAAATIIAVVTTIIRYKLALIHC